MKIRMVHIFTKRGRRNRPATMCGLPVTYASAAASPDHRLLLMKEPTTELRAGARVCLTCASYEYTRGGDLLRRAPRSSLLKDHPHLHNGVYVR